jgi:hypothetical protein
MITKQNKFSNTTDFECCHFALSNRYKNKLAPETCLSPEIERHPLKHLYFSILCSIFRSIFDAIREPDTHKRPSTISPSCSF